MVKKVDKKQTIWDNFLLQRQINQQSINNKSDKMDFADVRMILELEVRHPGDKEFMEKSNLLEN